METNLSHSDVMMVTPGGPPSALQELVDLHSDFDALRHSHFPLYRYLNEQWKKNNHTFPISFRVFGSEYKQRLVKTKSGGYKIIYKKNCLLMNKYYELTKLPLHYYPIVDNRHFVIKDTVYCGTSVDISTPLKDGYLLCSGVNKIYYDNKKITFETFDDLGEITPEKCLPSIIPLVFNLSDVFPNIVFVKQKHGINVIELVLTSAVRCDSEEKYFYTDKKNTIIEFDDFYFGSHTSDKTKFITNQMVKTQKGYGTIKCLLYTRQYEWTKKILVSMNNNLLIFNEEELTLCMSPLFC